MVAWTPAAGGGAPAVRAIPLGRRGAAAGSSSAAAFLERSAVDHLGTGTDKAQHAAVSIHNFAAAEDRGKRRRGREYRQEARAQNRGFNGRPLRLRGERPVGQAVGDASGRRRSDSSPPAPGVQSEAPDRPAAGTMRRARAFQGGCDSARGRRKRRRRRHATRAYRAARALRRQPNRSRPMHDQPRAAPPPAGHHHPQQPAAASAVLQPGAAAGDLIKQQQQQQARRAAARRQAVRRPGGCRRSPTRASSKSSHPTTTANEARPHRRPARAAARRARECGHGGTAAQPAAPPHGSRCPRSLWHMSDLERVRRPRWIRRGRQVRFSSRLRRLATRAAGGYGGGGGYEGRRVRGRRAAWLRRGLECKARRQRGWAASAAPDARPQRRSGHTVQAQRRSARQPLEQGLWWLRAR